MPKTQTHQAVTIFNKHGGVLRTSAAIKLGINPATLYRLHEQGTLGYVSRGVHRLTSLPELANPDLAVIATRLPDGVICLISALFFHGLTTQMPHWVYVALPRGKKLARIDHPPVRAIWLSGLAYSEGIESHVIDSLTVHIYSAEKTVADCFRYRNKIGVDVAIESLRDYVERGRPDWNKLLYYAKIDRVEKIMMPYIQSLQ